MRHLTGADVEIKSQTEAGQILFVCNQTGRNGNFKYHLGLESEDANEITYEPIVETKEDKAILKSLPGYMSSSISFSRKEVSIEGVHIGTCLTLPTNTNTGNLTVQQNQPCAQSEKTAKIIIT